MPGQGGGRWCCWGGLDQRPQERCQDFATVGKKARVPKSASRQPSVKILPASLAGWDPRGRQGRLELRVCETGAAGAARGWARPGALC